MKLWLAGCAVTIALLVAGCAGPSHPTAGNPSGGQARTPAPAPSASGRPAPTPTATPPSATPLPATASPSIPHHGQDLTFSGGFPGHVTQAEIKDCGTGQGLWGLDLSGLTLNGASASLSLEVNPYHGPGTYTLQGSLFVIANQQASTYSVTSGSVVIRTADQGTLQATFTASGQASIAVTGDWACAA